MKRKIRSRILLAICCFLAAWLLPAGPAYASDGEYITISVDATDDNGNLKYALDTDDPAAFTDSNEFVILAGTSHTIYVKDAAGNVTSQTYVPSSDLDDAPADSLTDPEPQERKNGQQINIDLEIERQNAGEDYSDYEYLTDAPVEPGTGTVAEKIKTDGSEDSERIFYTVTTKEGAVLYMIVDQGQSENNVYLLDTVSADDLLALADGTSGRPAEEKEDSLLAALSKENDAEEKDGGEAPSGSSGNLFIVLLFVLAGGGAYYYFKIYKNKKEEAMDVMDAMDMEDFEPEGEEEEADFDYDDEEKEKYLKELISGGETDLYDMSPEEYAASGDREEAYAEEPGSESRAEEYPDEYAGDYGYDEESEEQEDGI